MNWPQHMRLLHRMTGQLRFHFKTDRSSESNYGVITVTYRPSFTYQWGVRPHYINFRQDHVLADWLSQFKKLELIE